MKVSVFMNRKKLLIGILFTGIAGAVAATVFLCPPAKKPDDELGDELLKIESRIVQGLDCKSNIEKISKLLKNGANPDIKTPDGITPLMTISHLTIVKQLLEHGADVHLKSKNGCTALIYQASFRSPQAGDIVEILLEHGAKINAKDQFHGFTPLMMAVLAQSYQAVEVLCKRGAETNATSLVGRPALYFAARQGQLNTIDLLLKFGADPLISNKNGKNTFDLLDARMKVLKARKQAKTPEEWNRQDAISRVTRLNTEAEMANIQKSTAHLTKCIQSKTGTSKEVPAS